MLTGALLTLNLPHQMNFMMIAIPGLIAAVAIFMVNLKVSVDGAKAKQESFANSNVKAVKSSAH